MPLRYVLFMIGSLFILAGCHKSLTKVETVDQKPVISKTINQESESTRFLKRKVAIARFSNETVYGKGIFYDKENDPIAKQAMDILSSKLTSTDKFILLERADLEFINKELEFGNLQKLNIPADYLIVGSVSEFGRNTTSDVGIFSRSKKQTARAKVYLRLVDISTGQITYSEEGEGEASSEDATVLGVGSNAGYNSALNDQAISVAISKMVSNLVSNLLDKPWKSYLLDYDNGTYLISGGKSQGIMVGDVFVVVERGKKVINPQSNMLIELPGKNIAKIKVVSLAGDNQQNEIALCTIIEGEILTTDFSNLFVQEVK